MPGSNDGVSTHLVCLYIVCCILVLGLAPENASVLEFPGPAPAFAEGLGGGLRSWPASRPVAMQHRVVTLPDTSGAYCLRRARVPVCCLSGVDCQGWDVCVDGLALVDLTVREGRIQGIAASGSAVMNGHAQEQDRSLLPELDLAGKMVLPTFVDLHTHIGAIRGGACLCRRRHARASRS